MGANNQQTGAMNIGRTRAMHIFRKSKAEEIDEHDLPTEPIPHPPPQPQAYPSPHPYVPGLQTQQAPGNNAVYPYLPPAPARPRGKGGRIGNTVPVQPARQGNAARTRRSPIPRLVGLCFVVIQLLLLAHFVLKLINVPADVFWAGVVYETGDIFLLPFQFITQKIPLSIPANLEVLALLAIVVYGLLSRLLVHLLKALLRSDSAQR